MKRFNLGFMPLLLSLFVWNIAIAQAPAGFYKSAEGKNKKDLLIALNGIVGPHTAVSYDKLWTVFKTSDVRDNGYVWDMYSTTQFTPGQKQCGNYSKVGDCYNREHSFPKSWFNDAKPMYSDAYHLYPTDGKVNGQRSNYPFGECEGGTTLPPSGNNKALGRLGSSTFSGYSGTVFEPIDEYKGDFARSYFYMAAAYQDKIRSWSSPMLSNDDFPCYKTWAINLLLKWSRQDPVSDKEINRNNAVAVYQRNRNPFIDHPELAEYVWGTRSSEGWVPGGVVDPIIIAPANGQTVDMGVTSISRTLTLDIPVKAQAITQDLNVSLSNSTEFSLASATISKDAAIAGTTIKISYTSPTAGEDVTNLTISNSEVSSTVSLKAISYDGIPALQASNITMNAFTARWTNIASGGNYTLNVFKGNTNESIAGYPIQVAADKQQHDVTGLDYSTAYSYQLSDATLKSNIVSVTTADPERILSLIYDENALRTFQAEPGQISQPVEVTVYTEYITEQITAKVSGNFEISFDKINWTDSNLTMDSDGEAFYIRMKANNAEGTYTGEISLETATFIGSDADLIGVIAYPRSFFEDWEKTVGQGYDSPQVQGTACKWNLKDVGFFSTSADRFNGTMGSRFGKTSTSSIEMAEDKPNGVGSISFFAGSYGTDGDAAVDVKYSIDGGSTWVTVQNIKIEQAALKEYIIPMNIKGNVRIAIVQTAGKRIGVDDIALNDYSSVSNPTIADWSAYSVKGGIIVESDGSEAVEVYTIDAQQVFMGMPTVGKYFIELPTGIYVVANGNHGKKIIVK